MSALGRVLAEKYRLDAELGRGGMGVVYRGEHLATGRPVAVKVLRPETADDRTLGRRFVREVRAAAGLLHPNVVGVLDFGVEDDGTAYQVLELLEGESLGDRLDRGVLTPARTLELLLPIMHALELAHERGIVHRDLKPDNVFLSRNAHGRVVPKLLDFGIAKVRAADTPTPDGNASRTHTTQVGSVIGTPAYMSPEQARGAEVGTPSDIWAIAVLLFECLAGRLPFDDENASILMARVMLERAPSLTTVAPRVPRPLALAVDRALEPEPSARPPTMAAFAKALAVAATEAGIPLPPAGASDCPDDDPETGDAKAEIERAPTAARAVSAPPSAARPPRASTSASTRAGTPSSEPARADTPAPSRWPLVAIGLAALVVSAIALAGWMRTPDAPTVAREPLAVTPPDPTSVAPPEHVDTVALPPDPPVRATTTPTPPETVVPHGTGASRERPNEPPPATTGHPLATRVLPPPTSVEHTPPPSEATDLPGIREW